MTIGGTTLPGAAARSSCMATQNPIESEGTYPLPEAQVDRFLMKIVVDYPTLGEEAAVVGRSLGAPADVRERLTLERPRAASRRPARSVLVDRDVIGYAVALADATRHPGELRPRRHRGLDRVRRQPARADRPRAGGARAGAAARPRPRHRPATSATSRADVLRHRLVLSYDALSDGVTADELLERVLADGRPSPTADHVSARSAGWRRRERRGPAAARRPAGPRPHAARRWSTRSTSSSRATRPARCRATAAPPASARAPSSPSCARTRSATTCARSIAAATARTGEPHVRLHVPERTLTTWIVARRLAVDGVRHRRSG